MKGSSTKQHLDDRQVCAERFSPPIPSLVRVTSIARIYLDIDRSSPVPPPSLLFPLPSTSPFLLFLLLLLLLFSLSLPLSYIPSFTLHLPPFSLIC
jgi:hypothetical protein